MGDSPSFGPKKIANIESKTGVTRRIDHVEPVNVRVRDRDP